MTFLGLERPVEYGRQLIFDPTMANMVLRAQLNYVNAVKDDYLRGVAELQDFNKEYADLDSPILADNTSYYNLTKGGIKQMFDEAAKQGVDLLRSPEGRLMIQNYIATRPYDKLANLRKSRDAANLFLKNRAALEAQGLYNPALAKYDGPDLASYDTLQSGIWDKVSPTPYHNMADFSKAFFDNIQPFQRSARKNGISYTVSEIGMPDLHRIADAHFNDLVQTPQGQLMYKAFLDQNGGDADAARKNFNDAVVSGNIDRLRYSDNYDERAYQMENLAIKRQNLALRRQIAAAKARGDNGGPGTELQGISLAQSWYDTAMAKAYGANGYTVDWDKMHNLYGDFSRDAGKIFSDFGKKLASKTPRLSDAELDDAVKQSGTAAERDIVNRWKNPGLSSRTKELNDQYNKIKLKYSARVNGNKSAQSVNEAYRRQFTIDMDGKSVAQIIGTPLSENQMVARIGDGAIDKLYGLDDVVSNTAGYTKTHTTADTKKLRDAIRRWGVKNTTVTSMERGYGSLRKDTGSFEVNPEVKIVCTDDEGNVQYTGYGYYDIGLGSNSTKGGQYFGNYRETKGVMSPTGTWLPGRQGRFVEQRDNEGQLQDVRFVPDMTNMFPDYNRWTAFGVWDTDLTSKRLHGKASEYLGTYGNVYAGDALDNLLLDDEDEE